MTVSVQQFITALGTLEQDGTVEPIAALFSEDAAVANPMVPHPAQGQSGAAAFWRSYRGTFETIASEFRNVVEADGVACLEWVSTGTIRGAAVRYGGVSVLEFGDAGISSFRTYFDSAPIAAAVAADD